ncbi:hypothetical protein MMC18_009392 [Xylographa bjoerkii]|nr:hypothetical protein [Xylographa bjoerkii]
MEEPMSHNLFKKAMSSVHFLQGLLPLELEKPRIGIICGSGLGGLADAVDPKLQLEVPYHDIPHFPRSTVQGHVGKLLFGFFADEQLPVVLMVGRAHFYEGHTIHDITFPVRVLKLLGIDTLIVTNAAGGLNPAYAVGDIVILNDHLNLPGLAGIHPLRGPNAEEFGLRFPPLSDGYDLHLRRAAHEAWKRANSKRSPRRLHEGVYAFVGGPRHDNPTHITRPHSSLTRLSYETRAECRMLRGFGADVVGMSTVPEIIVARHSGVRVLAMSLVTNNAVLEAGPHGDDPSLEGLTRSQLLLSSEQGKASHEEVLEAGRMAAIDMQVLGQTLPNRDDMLIR